MMVAALNQVMLPAILPVHFPPEYPRYAIVGIHKVAEFEDWLHRHGITAFVVSEVRLKTNEENFIENPQVSKSYRLFMFERDKDIVFFKLGFG